jgi:hypothetical protein
MTSSSDDDYTFVMGTKISTTAHLNIMEWSCVSSLPIMFVGVSYIAHHNGFIWDLTQHNGHGLEHSLVHIGFCKASHSNFCV